MTRPMPFRKSSTWAERNIPDPGCVRRRVAADTRLSLFSETTIADETLQVTPPSSAYVLQPDISDKDNPLQRQAILRYLTLGNGQRQANLSARLVVAQLALPYRIMRCSFRRRLGVLSVIKLGCVEVHARHGRLLRRAPSRSVVFW